MRISRFQAGLWEELAALGVVDRQARAWQQQVAGLLSLDGLADTEVPTTLSTRLRPYQRDGFDDRAGLQGRRSTCLPHQPQGRRIRVNLTEADYCFLLDPWWNPATEAQAVDRTHRIGQTRNVMVYRLIAKDTIEDTRVAGRR